MKLDLTDQQLNNLFNTLCAMYDNAEKVKKMSNRELKDYIINSDIYGKLNITSFEIAVLEEVLERLYPTFEKLRKN